MSTSPHHTSDTRLPETGHDLLTGDPGRACAPDPLFDQEAPYVEASERPEDVVPRQVPIVGDVDPEAELDQTAYADDSYEYRTAPAPARSTVYASLPGMPGRGVVLVTGLATGSTAVADFALTGGLSYFFDLTFVVICLVAAMAVRGHDLFTTGVLPPLAFGATMAVVTLVAPETFVAQGGLSKTFLTGLTSHAGALVFGYGTALATVAGRAAHHRGR